MPFTTPAPWFNLCTDDVIINHPTALRVYAILVREYPEIFHEPRDVKAWLLADQVPADRQTIAAAINLLIRRGFVVEHARGLNNIRRLTLVAERHLLGQSGSVIREAERRRA